VPCGLRQAIDAKFLVMSAYLMAPGAQQKRLAAYLTPTPNWSSRIWNCAFWIDW
jgi:hypothetical protein